MARVIPQDDGRIDVLVDSRVLASGQEPGMPEETFEREALHIALRQRGECLDFDQRDCWDDGIASNRLQAAEIACEEFRVELPLNRQRPGLHYESFPRLLQAFDGNLRQLNRTYQASPNEPDRVAVISRDVGEQFGSIITSSGYVAAAMEANGLELPQVDPAVSERIMGSQGRAVFDRLRDLPPADEAADVDDLEVVVRDVAGPPRLLDS
jgi:hypothetical protein